MTKYWLAKITDDKYFYLAVENNFWLMQQQYNKQHNAAVTNMWTPIRDIKEGDYFLLGYGNSLHAIGRVCKPRVKTKNINTSNLARTIQNRSHKFKEGIVLYDDSEVFYENFTDFKGEWGQRIDVEKWEYYSEKGVSNYGIQDGSAGGLSVYTIFEITKDYFDNKANQLKKKYMENLSFEDKVFNLLKSNKNIILNGAPGTGKTYLAKELAKRIVSAQDYPAAKSNSIDIDLFKKWMSEKIYDGVSKYAENTLANYKRAAGFFAREFGGLDNVLSQIETIRNVFKPKTPKDTGGFRSATLTLLEKYAKTALTDSDNIYFDKDNSSKIVFVQFHPSYDYTDFVEGLRPIKTEGNHEIGFELRNGIFKELCKNAYDNQSQKQPYVLIIDEINRAEISKVFGELFFSIDQDYRGPKGTVKTQYSNMQTDETRFADELDIGDFFVPENVYIIGTMNDIDRSVETFDFAMRRRFTWVEITADERIGMLDVLGPEIKAQAKAKMKAINEVIGGNKENKGIIEGLNSSYNIGPAYFLKLKDCNNDFSQLWIYHIEPLVKEYLRGLPNADKDLKIIHDAFNRV